MKQAQLIGDFVPVVDFYPEPVPSISFKELYVLKTTTRTMHTIRHRTFIARQIYLYQPDHKYANNEEKKIKKYTSQEFHAMVRGKSGFTMEVVCAAGMLRFIKNKSREETQEEIYREYGLLLSTGTISNLSLEFLIRFEMYHSQHFNLLVDTMKKDGGYILGADGTGDGGSDRILLLMDLIRGWSLSYGVIPSEKEGYITPLFDDLINKAGDPLAFVRDMGCGLRKAGEKLFSDILTKECNFHFVRDAGKDMMTANYQELKKVMVRLNVRSDLAKLRKILNYEAKSKSIDLHTTMQSLRENAPVEDIDEVIFTETYHLISWILNYTEESHCQRFPYSLPWVYLYKRCYQGMGTAYEILSTATNAKSDLSHIKEVQKIIERPFHDKTATVLTDLEHRLKRGQNLFLDLRGALKIPEDKGDIPRGNLFISDEESLEIEKSLKKFRYQLSLAVEKGTSTPEEEIVLEHLIRHWNWLGASNLTVTVNGEEKKISIPRAISLVDARFSQVKSSIRKRTGKKDTGRELNRYGALLCLLQNLHSEEYVKVMFNSIENIPNALGKIPKEEVDKALEEFKNAQCRYDVTCARGDNEFETFLTICKKISGEVVSSTVEKSHNLLIEACDPTSILTDS